MPDRNKVNMESINGLPCIFHNAKTKVAVVPAIPGSTDGSIIIHERYVPGYCQLEIREVAAHRLGRTLSILSEEVPSFFADSYPMLSIKGTGADAMGDLMRVHPSKWYVPPKDYGNSQDKGKWINLEEAGGSIGRVWGAVKADAAWAEFSDPLFTRFAPYISPHLGLNKMLPEMCSSISDVESADPVHEYHQIVRGCRTNIRMGMCMNGEVRLPEQAYVGLLPRIVAADAHALGIVLSVASLARYISFAGDIADNRYLNGDFTDAENFELMQCKSYPGNTAISFPVSVINASCNFLPEKLHETYLSELENATSLPYCSSMPPELSRRAVCDIIIADVTRRAFMEAFPYPY